MRSNIIVIVLLFSGTLSCLGQRKTEIQFVVTPTFSNRYLTAPTRDFAQSYNQFEKGMFSFDAGVLVVPFRVKNIRIGTGLIYSRKGFVWADFKGRDLDGGQAVHIKVKEVLHFLEIPIQFTYAFPRHHHTYFVAGLLNDILISSKMITNLPFNPYVYEKRRYNLGVNLGIGYNFRISNTLVMAIEPNIKFQSMPYLEKKTPARRYLYTAGVSVVTKLSR